MLSYAVCGTGAVSRARQRHNIRAGGVRSIIAEGLYAVELITSTEGVVVVAGYSQWSKGESAVEDRKGEHTTSSTESSKYWFVLKSLSGFV